MSPALRRVELKRLRARFQENLSDFISAEVDLALFVSELRVVEPDHPKLRQLERAEQLVTCAVDGLVSLADQR